jgi:DNA-binding protein HU-beta
LSNKGYLCETISQINEVKSDAPVGQVTGEVGMNKRQLAAAVAKQAGISQVEANKVIETALSTIAKTLKGGEKVRLTGFGTFEVPSQKRAKAGASAGKRAMSTTRLQAIFSPSPQLRISDRPTKTDMDERWEESFAASTHVLDRLSEQALEEYRAGRASPLDPDAL